MNTKFDFGGAVVVVTGASGAIGGETARAFHEAGAHVIVTGRNARRLEALVSELGPTRCQAVPGDLADPAHRAEITAVAAAHGGATILVNNAGVTKSRKPTAETTLADFDDIVGVNLRAVYDLSLAIVREWLAQERPGVIVNVSSPGAQRAHRNNALYDISKGGIDALTRCLAVDFGSRGVRVNAVAPAQIPHSHTESVDPSAAYGLPMRRHATPREAALPILFLSSDCASFITGQVLPVDGGLMAQLRTPIG
ncbi:SDR family NAD(P)-dependent oxidoreductase [Pandoraea anhela]|uniref:Sugar dehydrogenase n=1 Tax=Pandoraea anhela TaxID=2508295 RepID=A0A5E4WCR8_9BURK|nr:SDR family oxidoreductase [Pandoraea anhela]VVE21464.1 sugar dehydrogenase [Pandoraea anhela]